MMMKVWIESMRHAGESHLDTTDCRGHTSGTSENSNLKSHQEFPVSRRYQNESTKTLPNNISLSDCPPNGFVVVGL